MNVYTLTTVHHNERKTSAEVFATHLGAIGELYKQFFTEIENLGWDPETLDSEHEDSFYELWDGIIVDDSGETIVYWNIERKEVRD